MKFRLMMVLFAVLVPLLAGCATQAGSEKVKVKCPECGTDFDALFYKRF